MLIVCDICKGEGITKRTPDGGPLDFRHEEVCSKCGGGGKVDERAAGTPEPRGGYVADQIRVTGFWSK